MSSPPYDPEETVGTIAGIRGGCIVVRTDNGDEVMCRSLRALHRKFGFYAIPVGRRVRIRFRSRPKDKTPLIVEVLPE